MRPRHARWALVALSGLAAGCASTAAERPEPRYLVRAIPGPDGLRSSYAFERRHVSIVAKADRDGDDPWFELDLANRGIGRVTLAVEEMRLRSKDPELSSPALLLDGEDEPLTHRVLLGFERRTVRVRAARADFQPEGAVTLEVRGWRDDRGDGGFDFDLLATLRPEPDPDQIPPKVIDETGNPDRVQPELPRHNPGKKKPGDPR